MPLIKPVPVVGGANKMGDVADMLIEECLLAEFDAAPDFDKWKRMGRFKQLRKQFVWTDKSGNEHKLADIDDYYLGNIIKFLEGKLLTTPDVDYDPGDDTIKSNEYELERIDAIVTFLKTEQKYREWNQTWRVFNLT